MKQNTRVFILSCCVAAGMGGIARADDPFADIAKSFINEVGGVLTDELKHQIETKRLESHALIENGYCQVWRSGQLAVQKECELKHFCDTEGVCTHRYRWPTGSVSELILKDEMPVTINGHQSGLALVGNDQCVKDGLESVFCYTRTKQVADLAVTVTPVSAVPDQQEIPAVVHDPILAGDTRLTATPISLPPPETNEDIIVETPLAVPTTSKSQETTASINVGTPQQQNVPELLLAQFVAALENSSDPTSKAKRCALGPTLLTVYGTAFDEETKSSIHGQLVQDGCA